MALKNRLNLGEISKITVLDSLTYSGNLRNLEEVIDDSRLDICIGSINDAKSVRKCLSDKSLVINFAAESHVDRSIENADNFIETNINGTYILLKEAKVQNVARIIHVSTDEVYGSTRNGEFSEDSPLLPNSPYAASKAASDLIARSFYITYKLPIIITRCTNNYGPYQHPEKLVPLSITNLIQNTKVPIYGLGNNVRDWIHVEDHCRAIALVARVGELGEIYNISGDMPLKNIEIVSKILKIMGFDESSIEFVPDRLGHDFRYAINDSKIKMLGYQPNTPFEDGITNLVKWYVENKSWWLQSK